MQLPRPEHTKDREDWQRPDGMGQSSWHCPPPVQSDVTHASPTSHTPFPQVAVREVSTLLAMAVVVVSWPEICSLDNPLLADGSSWKDTTGVKPWAGDEDDGVTTGLVTTTTLEIWLGPTPRALLSVAAVTTPPADSQAGFKVAVTVTLHMFVPLQTPQLSSAPVMQHTPEGGRLVGQQVPCTSTATPRPPHTPHASTVPTGQHVPYLSTTRLPVQHSPVVASTAPLQHVPAMSTTPAVHVEGPARRGIWQESPAQRGSHTHSWDVVLHIWLAPVQSEDMMHLHEEGMMHAVVAAGLVRTLPLMLAARKHSRSGNTSPLVFMHSTVRAWEPSMETQGSLRLLASEEVAHVDQGPTVHVAMLVGHRNRLQGRIVRGCAKPALWQMVGSTRAKLSEPLLATHTGGGAVATPSVAESLKFAMQGVEQALQVSLVLHDTAGQAAPLQADTDLGTSTTPLSSAHSALSTAMPGPRDDAHVVTHRTARVTYPVVPRPQGAEHSDHGETIQEYGDTAGTMGGGRSSTGDSLISHAYRSAAMAPY